jgi:hypothetical protein
MLTLPSSKPSVDRSCLHRSLVLARVMLIMVVKRKRKRVKKRHFQNRNHHNVHASHCRGQGEWRCSYSNIYDTAGLPVTTTESVADCDPAGQFHQQVLLHRSLYPEPKLWFHSDTEVIAAAHVLHESWHCRGAFQQHKKITNTTSAVPTRVECHRKRNSMLKSRSRNCPCR